MRVLEQLKEFIRAEEFEKAEKLAVSAIIQLPHIEELYSILVDIYLKTGTLKLISKPLKPETDYLIKSIGYKLSVSHPEKAIEFYKKILDFNNNQQWLFETIANLYLDIGLNYLKGNFTKKAKESLKMSFKFNINKIDLCTKIVGFSCTADTFNTKIFEILEPLMNFWDMKPHKDKTLLLYASSQTEGMGDGIKFIKILCYLQNYFKEIKVLVRPELIRLFEHSFKSLKTAKINFFNIWADFEEHYDYTAIAGPLFYYFKNEMVLGQKYLKAKPAKVKYFKEKYFNTDKPKVGICWHGVNNQNEIFKYRSMSLNTLRDIINLENIQFYSLQKEDFQDLENFSNVINLANELNDFEDTAAAIENLDLVITIDTSIAHLSGALDKKTFLMLPFETFAWWFGKGGSKLYDSIEIFQQKELKNWHNVIVSIKERLIKIDKKTTCF